MKIVMKASRPNDVELTMALTMTLGDWLMLAEQCKTAYPGWQLSSAIGQMAAKVKASFEEQIERP